MRAYSRESTHNFGGHNSTHWGTLPRTAIGISLGHETIQVLFPAGAWAGPEFRALPSSPVSPGLLGRGLTWNFRSLGVSSSLSLPPEHPVGPGGWRGRPVHKGRAITGLGDPSLAEGSARVPSRRPGRAPPLWAWGSWDASPSPCQSRPWDTGLLPEGFSAHSAWCLRRTKPSPRSRGVQWGPREGKGVVLLPSGSKLQPQPSRKRLVPEPGAERHRKSFCNFFYLLNWRLASPLRVSGLLSHGFPRGHLAGGGRCTLMRTSSFSSFLLFCKLVPGER